MARRTRQIPNQLFRIHRTGGRSIGVRKRGGINRAGPLSASMNGRVVEKKSECSRMTFGVPPSVAYICIYHMSYTGSPICAVYRDIMRINVANAGCKRQLGSTIAREGAEVDVAKRKGRHTETRDVYVTRSKHLHRGEI